MPSVPYGHWDLDWEFPGNLFFNLPLGVYISWPGGFDNYGFLFRTKSLLTNMAYITQLDKNIKQVCC